MNFTLLKRLMKKADSKENLVKSHKASIQNGINDKQNNISVITKSRAPQIILQSEHINNSGIKSKEQKSELLKSICLIIMGIIVLLTFFISLNTYRIVNQLTNTTNIYTQGN